MANNVYMDEFISDGQKEVISLKNMYDTYLVSSVDNPSHIIRIPLHDFFLEHQQALQKIIQLYPLSENYFYKPKLLSLDLYGTTEFWLAILRANKMKDSTEFHKPLIGIYEPNQLKELMSIYFKREKKIT